MQSTLCTDCGISQADITIIFGIYNSQTRGPVWGTPQKSVSDDLLFHLSPIFLLSRMAPKLPGLKKYTFQKGKYYLLEGNFSPSWRNTLGHILLDTMDESSAYFTIITNNICSNIRPHMLVLFLLVTLH